MGASALWYLERRKIVNTLRRARREPRRLLPWIGVPLALARLAFSGADPHQVMPLGPLVAQFGPLLAALMVAGLLVRLGIPSPPLYFAEAADLVYVVPAGIPPRSLYLRRAWNQIQVYLRMLAGLIFALVWVSLSPTALNLVAVGVLYLVALDQLGLVSYRVKAAGWPVGVLGIGLAALYLALRALHVPDPTAGLLIDAMTSGGVALVAVAAGVVGILWLGWWLAPEIRDVDWARVAARAKLRAAARGDAPWQAAEQARQALRSTGVRRPPRASHAIRGRGAWALAEVQILLALRRLQANRVQQGLVLIAAVWGVVAAHLGARDLVATLGIAAYASLFTTFGGQVLQASPFLAGVPRTTAMLFGEQAGALIGPVGFWLLVWLAAVVAGMPADLAATGAVVLVAIGLIASALRIHLWSWFPEAPGRSVAGRFLGVPAGGVLYGIAGLGFLLPSPWNLVAIMGLAAAESWALTRWTTARFTWAAGMVRVYGTE